MENLKSQPFLLSLEDTVNQTGSRQAYEDLLLEHQSRFKEYLHGCTGVEMPAPGCFNFLETVNFELGSIRWKHADKIREHDKNLYHFWSMIISDTQRYVAIGVATLRFRIDCPAHLFTEPPVEQSQSLSPYEWTGSRIELTEVITGLFLMGAIRMKDGSTLEFAPLARYIGGTFDVAYKYPNDEMAVVLNRKKSRTPFLLRMISRIKEKI